MSGRGHSARSTAARSGARSSVLRLPPRSRPLPESLSPGAWIVALAGTDAGSTLAMLLALLSAVAHAAFGAMQKGRYDPWLMRAAVDVWFPVLMLPFVLLVVPWPTPALWLVLAGAMGIHLAYKWLMAMAYERGAFTAVYPVVRGTGPLATVVFAMVLFGERYTAGQWAGLALLSGGIFGLALYNVLTERLDPQRLHRALGLAFATGILTGVYTAWDAYGIRLAENPFTFLAWFFFVEGLVFPVLGVFWWRAAPDRPPPLPLLRRGLVGALTALVSFGAVMLATRLDAVGEAAALRETSVMFAALIGWLVLGDTMGPRRLALMALIAIGAILVEFG